MERIYSECHTLTATGRVSLHEPNIQNVPNDFEFTATTSLLKKALGSNFNISKNQSANRSASLFMSQYASFLIEDPQIDPEKFEVSLRKAFVSSEGCLILSADYSQLELRILAHLSQDKKLLQILGPQNPDVFKAMAAKWKLKNISQVDQNERQQVKQICYGILYGIGNKALSEQLEVCEEEATAFTCTFMDTYPGMWSYACVSLLYCHKMERFVLRIINLFFVMVRVKKIKVPFWPLNVHGKGFLKIAWITKVHKCPFSGVICGLSIPTLLSQQSFSDKQFCYLPSIFFKFHDILEIVQQIENNFASKVPYILKWEL